ncbi:MAG: SoxR reducing system RseC family protein [Mariprofundaceae bacterium]
MEQQVFVVAVEDQVAIVRTERLSGCGSCAGKSACGTLGSWSSRFSEMPVQNSLGAVVGDEVMITAPDGELLRAAFMAYGLPILLFVLAGSVASVVAEHFVSTHVDLWASTAGFLALALSLFLISKQSTKNRFCASIVRIVNRNKQQNIPIGLIS